MRFFNKLGMKPLLPLINLSTLFVSACVLNSSGGSSEKPKNLLTQWKEETSKCSTCCPEKTHNDNLKLDKMFKLRQPPINLMGIKNIRLIDPKTHKPISARDIPEIPLTENEKKIVDAFSKTLKYDDEQLILTEIYSKEDFLELGFYRARYSIMRSLLFNSFPEGSPICKLNPAKTGVLAIVSPREDKNGNRVFYLLERNSEKEKYNLKEGLFSAPGGFVRPLEKKGLDLLSANIAAELFEELGSQSTEFIHPEVKIESIELVAVSYRYLFSENKQNSFFLPTAEFIFLVKIDQSANFWENNVLKKNNAVDKHEHVGNRNADGSLDMNFIRIPFDKISETLETLKNRELPGYFLWKPLLDSAEMYYKERLKKERLKEESVDNNDEVEDLLEFVTHSPF